MGIRVATADDVPQIAKIHKARFSTHFLGQYSVSLINRFYLTFLGRAIFLVHEAKSGIDGFVLGGESAVLSTCKKEFVTSNLSACIWETLWRPRLYLAGFNRACRFVLLRKLLNTSMINVSLFSIAVDEHVAGKGVATLLVHAFESGIRGRASIYELAVRKDNLRAIRFYEKMGFDVQRQNNSGIRFVKRLAA